MSSREFDRMIVNLYNATHATSPKKGKVQAVAPVDYQNGGYTDSESDCSLQHEIDSLRYQLNNMRNRNAVQDTFANDQITHVSQQHNIALQQANHYISSTSSRLDKVENANSDVARQIKNLRDLYESTRELLTVQEKTQNMLRDQIANIGQRVEAVNFQLQLAMGEIKKNTEELSQMKTLAEEIKANMTTPSFDSGFREDEFMTLVNPYHEVSSSEHETVSEATDAQVLVQALDNAMEDPEFKSKLKFRIKPNPKNRSQTELWFTVVGTNIVVKRFYKNRGMTCPNVSAWYQGVRRSNPDAFKLRKHTSKHFIAIAKEQWNQWAKNKQ